MIGSLSSPDVSPAPIPPAPGEEETPVNSCPQCKGTLFVLKELEGVVFAPRCRRCPEGKKLALQAEEVSANRRRRQARKKAREDRADAGPVRAGQADERGETRAEDRARRRWWDDD